MEVEGMREILKKRIIDGYNRGLDEVGVHRREIYGFNYELLTRGEIGIDTYLNSLTDEEMIDAFDSQCCQDYR